VFTTTSMMAESVSMRTDQVDWKSPTWINGISSMMRSWPSPQTKSTKIGQDSASERPTDAVVRIMATRSPM